MDTDKTIPAEIISNYRRVKIAIIGGFIVLVIAIIVFFLSGEDKNQSVSSFQSESNTADSQRGNSPEMVEVDGGTAVIGTDRFPEDRNSPERRIEFKGFSITKYEISNKQYMEFVRNTGHQPPSNEFWPAGRFRTGEDRYPVVGISRDDASDYCKYYGMRLPTEEEWEFAARTDSGNYYPWGNTTNPAAGNIASGFPTNTGESKWDVNSTGIYDLAGNVREWTSSETDMKSQQGYLVRYYIVRGGSWEKLNGLETSRLTHRGFIMAGDVRAGYNNIGFRCIAGER